MKIYVAGHNGMVGSAIVRLMSNNEFFSNITLITRTRRQLDLTQQSEVKKFMSVEKPDVIIIAAAKVGGIYANNLYPAQFIYENLIIQANLIHQAHESGVQKLLFLGSSCIYPRMAPQPMSETSLLSGILEPTNEPYAIAKIAGIKMCESYNRQYGRDYRSIMPTNLYGPKDNFQDENSHVIPGLMRRFHDAKTEGLSSVDVWGDGSPRREFLHVNEMADASLFVLRLPKNDVDKFGGPMLSHINIGTGQDISIFDLAELIKKVVGFAGEILFLDSKPNGTPRKLLSVERINELGWRHKIGLEEGLRDTYRWFLKNQTSSVDR